MAGSRGHDTVSCAVCRHGCTLKEAQLGLCGVRQRKGDKVESLVYGRVVAENVDPIEKKPLFHLLPGSLSYSVSTVGCNFRCLHCQNASISQVAGMGDITQTGVYRSPEMIVKAALRSGCRSISYTYVEPTVFFEYGLDCCTLAYENNLKNVFVSNGYMSESSLAALTPVLSAINIDLKAFSDSFYRKVCGARLEPVLDNIRHLAASNILVEVTTLVIPALNDSDEELTGIAEFLCGVDKNIPWHVSGFYPTYKMTTVPPTPLGTLQKAREIGLGAGLNFVYTGNSPGSGGECSYCPGCGTELIERVGFRVIANKLVAGGCPRCNTEIPGIWR